VSRRWLLNWALICALAEALGLLAAGMWYGTVMAVLGEPEALAPRLGVWAAASLAAVTEGIILGGIQAWWLHHLWPSLSARRWIAATIAVGLIGWGFGTAVPLFLAPEGGAPPSLPMLLGFAALFGAVAGLLFGVVQALALPARAQPRRAWVLGNVAGWAVGLPLIYAAAHLGADAATAAGTLAWWAAGGAAGGLAIGACTGLALMRMAPAPARVGRAATAAVAHDT
jgi:hypothetical protein